MKDFKKQNIKNAIKFIYEQQQQLELQRAKDDSEFGFLAALEKIIFILEGSVPKVTRIYFDEGL